MAAFGALCLAGCQDAAKTESASAPAGTNQKPNIIYILADDMGYGDVSAYGQKRFKTPHIDRLAESGMLFTQHYSGAAVCAPSRSTLLTGQHTGMTQIRHNGGGRKPGTFLEKGQQTLITMLGDAGYTTGAVGKWGMGNYDNSGSPSAQGLDYFYGYVEHKDAHNYYPPYLVENGEKQILDNNGIDVHGARSKDKSLNPEDVYREFIGKDYAPDLIHEKAKTFIADNKDGPFFLYYASTIPHAALQVPDRGLAEFNFPETPDTGDYYTHHPRPRAARAALMRRLDNEVGGVLDFLDAEGLRDNTLIIFASDNGATPEGGADMDFFDVSNPFRGYKRNLTEGGIRVPMIASWPGKIKAGVNSDHVTAMWDVMPTLADISGAQISGVTTGISIAPTLLGQGEQIDHEYLYWEFHGGKRHMPAQAVRMGDWKALRLYKFVKKGVYETLPTQLYDLERDPKELNDLAAQNPQIVAQMEAIMMRRSPSIVPGWNF